MFARKTHFVTLFSGESTPYFRRERYEALVFVVHILFSLFSTFLRAYTIMYFEHYWLLLVVN